MFARALALALFLLAPAFLPVRAAELITNYLSDITINQDSSLTIKETITLNVEGIDIRRGILRTYPTRYKLESGDTVTVSFDVESITRDGKDEP